MALLYIAYTLPSSPPIYVSTHLYSFLLSIYTRISSLSAHVEYACPFSLSISVSSLYVTYMAYVHSLYTSSISLRTRVSLHVPYTHSLFSIYVYALYTYIFSSIAYMLYLYTHPLPIAYTRTCSSVSLYVHAYVSLYVYVCMKGDIGDVYISENKCVCV